MILMNVIKLDSDLELRVKSIRQDIPFNPTVVTVLNIDRTTLENRTNRRGEPFRFYFRHEIVRRYTKVIIPKNSDLITDVPEENFTLDSDRRVLDYCIDTPNLSTSNLNFFVKDQKGIIYGTFLDNSSENGFYFCFSGFKAFSELELAQAQNKRLIFPESWCPITNAPINDFSSLASFGDNPAMYVDWQETENRTGRKRWLYSDGRVFEYDISHIAGKYSDDDFPKEIIYKPE